MNVVIRIFGANALIRASAAASGQLFAYLLAERMGARAGAGAWLVGLLAAFFYVSELLGAPLAGRLADVRGQRRVLGYGPLFGIVSCAAGALAALEVSSVAALTVVLAIARMSEGLSAACATPTTLVLLSRATVGDHARRTRLMGLFEITSLVAMIAGYVVAGLSWDALGPRAFLLLSPLYGVAWLLVRARATADPADSAEPASRPMASGILAVIAELARERGAVAFGVAWLSVNAVVGVWMQQAPYLLKLPVRSHTQTLVGGFDARQIGLVFGAFGVVFLLGLTLWSVLGARFSRRRSLGVALVGMLGVVSTLALRNHGIGSGVLALTAVFVLVESGFTPAALAHLADLSARHDRSRGAALGLYSLLLGAGQLIGNALGAPFAARWQMDGVLALTAILASVALVSVALMGRTPPARAATSR